MRLVSIFLREVLSVIHMLAKRVMVAAITSVEMNVTVVFYSPAWSRNLGLSQRLARSLCQRERLVRYVGHRGEC